MFLQKSDLSKKCEKTSGCSQSIFPTVKKNNLIIWVLTIVHIFFYYANGKMISGNLKCSQLTQEDGLSHNQVTAIVQDDFGFIWIGTKDGLNKYDGYNLTVIRNVPDDSTSLSHNQITCLLKDKNGNIWVGTTDGLNLYDQHTGKFERYFFDPKDQNSISSSSIRSLYQNSQNILWIGTSRGLNQLDIIHGKVRRYYHEQNDPTARSANIIFAVEEDLLGRIWLGSHNGLIIYDPLKDSFSRITFSGTEETKIKRNAAFKIISLSTGVMLIGTLDGTRRVEVDSSAVLNVSDIEDLDDRMVFDMLEDTTGHLWVGTSDGLIHTNLLSGNSKIFKSVAGDPNSLTNNSINCLMKDYSGLIWIGTDMGLNIYDPSVGKFVQYFDNPLNDSDLNNNNIRSVYQEPEGIIWIGTDHFLYSYDPITEKYVHHKCYYQDNLFQNLAVSDILPGVYPYLWLATTDGVYQFNRKNGKTRNYKYESKGFREIKNNFINKLTDDGENNLWVGSFGGLLHLDLQSGKFKKYGLGTSDTLSLAYNIVTYLLRDKSGRLWVGTERGLNLLETKDSMFRHFYYNMNLANSLGSDHITAIYEDRQGNIWIATYGGGLNRYRPETQDFLRITTKDGLPSDVIKGIIQDDNRQLWLSTNQGLCRINFDHDPLEISVFDKYDGIRNIEFNANATFRNDSSGELFFGGRNGMTSFNPDSITINKTPPKIIFTSLRIFNKPIAVGSGILPEPLYIINKILLDYTQNFFMVEFASPHFGGVKANKYAYRLNGFDQDWIFTDSDQHYCIYTNMNPGEYSLQVIAANEDGIWNKKGVSLEINIVPPFWHRWWFRALITIMIAGMILLIIQFRTRQVARRNQELQTLNVQLNHEIVERKDAEQKVLQLNLELERRVRQRTHQLEIANKELEAFAYSVSHDLRAPLRAIGGFSQMILNEYNQKLDEHGAEYLQRIQNGVNRMSQLIDDLLTLSRINREELKFKPVNLSSLVREIVDQKTNENPDRQVEYKIQPDLEVLCDNRLMRVALENLLENAWKFTVNNKKTVIEFGYKKVSDSGWYFIRDNGVGFDMKYIDKLFTPFGRLHSAEEFSGTGIGLATVQRIIHRHSGQIKAESEAGNGAVFLFTLDQLYKEPLNHRLV